MDAGKNQEKDGKLSVGKSEPTPSCKEHLGSQGSCPHRHRKTRGTPEFEPVAGLPKRPLGDGPQSLTLWLKRPQ